MPNNPTPTALNELRGNPGKRGRNKQEPKPEVGVPPLPAHWNGPNYKLDREEWERVVETLPPGLLTLADASMLELYCELRAVLRRMRSKGTPPIPSLVAQVRALASAFGLEPASRVKLAVEKGTPASGPEGDVWADLLRQEGSKN